jgi:hypothetical protein
MSSNNKMRTVNGDKASMLKRMIKGSITIVPVNLAFKMVKSIDTFLETLFLDVIFLV